APRGARRVRGRSTAAADAEGCRRRDGAVGLARRRRLMTAWREGHALLAERLRALPAALRADVCLRGAVPRAARRFVTTGAGGSGAHGRFLAQLLGEHAGVAARFEPLGRFASPLPADAAETVLVVFSQGLSPNAWLALAMPQAWQAVVLV